MLTVLKISIKTLKPFCFAQCGADKKKSQNVLLNVFRTCRILTTDFDLCALWDFYPHGCSQGSFRDDEGNTLSDGIISYREELT